MIKCFFLEGKILLKKLKPSVLTSYIVFAEITVIRLNDTSIEL